MTEMTHRGLGGGLEKRTFGQPKQNAHSRGHIKHDRVVTLFISPSGVDTNSGEVAASPLKSLGQALRLAAMVNNSQPVDINVAAGKYMPLETLVLRSNLSITGGWDATFKKRELKPWLTAIESASNIAVSCDSEDNIELNMLTLVAANATESGASSIGMVLESCSGVQAFGVQVIAGQAAAGQSGGRGGNGEDGGESDLLC
jgi:hypothetical protein